MDQFPWIRSVSTSRSTTSDNMDAKMTLEERIHNLEQRVNALEFENRMLKREQKHSERMREIESISRTNEINARLGLPLRPYPEVTFELDPYVEDRIQKYIDNIDKSRVQKGDDMGYPKG